MAVSRRQIYICDKHDNEGEEVLIEGDSFFGFDGQWYRIGFCPICDKALIALAREFIIEHGIRVPAEDVVIPGGGTMTTPAKKGGKGGGGSKTKEKPAKCLLCNWGESGKGTIGGLNAHVKRHGFAGSTEMYGEKCPLCNDDGFTALGRHAMAHQLESANELFFAAIAAGDPYGVVAERMKAAV